jgi:hypothetical protein
MKKLLFIALAVLATSFSMAEEPREEQKGFDLEITDNVVISSVSEAECLTLEVPMMQITYVVNSSTDVNVFMVPEAESANRSFMQRNSIYSDNIKTSWNLLAIPWRYHNDYFYKMYSSKVKPTVVADTKNTDYLLSVIPNIRSDG